MRERTIANLVASAERHIAARKYSLALEELAAAKSIEPKNYYIDAIIDRVINMQQATMTDGTKTRYLSITVGSQFPDGVREDQVGQTVSITEGLARVRLLTRNAERQLDEGAVENAFESLMNAYLIDPNNPAVLSCEKRVLPAWKAVSNNPEARAKISERWRLEMLKQHKDIERKEKERAMWRQASKPLAIMKEVGETRPVSIQAPPQENTEKSDRGLFSKLKRGKFLG